MWSERGIEKENVRKNRNHIASQQQSALLLIIYFVMFAETILF